MSDISYGTHESDTTDKDTVISKPELVRAYARLTVETSPRTTVEKDCLKSTYITRPVLRRSNENTHVHGNHTGITKSKDSTIDVLEEYFLREHK